MMLVSGPLNNPDELLMNCKSKSCSGSGNCLDHFSWLNWFDQQVLIVGGIVGAPRRMSMLLSLLLQIGAFKSSDFWALLPPAGWDEHDKPPSAFLSV